MTKSHDMIFQDWSVRAILDGSKTRTMRRIKPSNSLLDGNGVREWPGGSVLDPSRISPRIQPGNEIVVKCTWAVEDDYDDCMPREIDFENATVFCRALTPGDSPSDACNIRGRWRSPIFMPRAATPATLRVTGVKAQRPQELSGQEIISEGLAHSGDAQRRWYEIWTDIHGPGAYEINDLCWVYEFDLERK